MEAIATAKFVRMAPRKVRFVLDTVRGKYAREALAQLQFTPNHAAVEIAKVVKSACANAESNFGLNADALKIVRCFVDGGPTLKRVQPRAQGRAYRILKRTSHITVVVEDIERPVVPAKGRAKPVGRRQPLLAATYRRPGAAPMEEAVAPVENDEAPQPIETVEEVATTAAAPATDEVAATPAEAVLAEDTPPDPPVATAPATETATEATPAATADDKAEQKA